MDKLDVFLWITGSIFLLCMFGLLSLLLVTLAESVCG